MRIVAVLLLLACSIVDPWQSYAQPASGEEEEVSSNFVSGYDPWARNVIRKVKSTEDTEKRLDILDKAMAEKPNTEFLDDLLLWKAQLIRGSGRDDEVIPILNRLIEDFPGSVQNRFPLLEAYEKRSGGLAVFMMLTKISDYLKEAPIKTSDNARMELAEIYVSEKDYKKALEIASEILKANEATYEKSEPFLDKTKENRSYVLAVIRPEVRALTIKLGILERTKEYADAAPLAFEALKKYPYRIDVPEMVRRYLMDSYNAADLDRGKARINSFRSQVTDDQLRELIDAGLKDFENSDKDKPIEYPLVLPSIWEIWDKM